MPRRCRAHRPGRDEPAHQRHPLQPRPGGSSRSPLATEGSAVLLTVADTGEGIPPEDIPHLFERFYRADKSRSRIQGRNGLGLAICKAIVEAHGGSIEVSSQPGVGSTFTVKLPS